MSSNPPNPPGSFPPPGKPNPFSTPSSSRPSTPPPSSLFSRLGARATLDYVPMHDTLIMFDLNDVAPSICDLIGVPITSTEENGGDVNVVKTLISALEKDKSLTESLKAQLHEYWDQIQLTGAVHVYDWREEVKESAVRRLNAVKAPPNYVRASDPLLVLNVLARARSYLLISSAALALDRPFLERVVMTDDPRLLSFGKSDFNSAPLIPPPPPTDDVFEDLDDDDDDNK